MSAIIIETQLTKNGIECTHPILGKVATIIREFGENGAEPRWFVQPYTSPIYEDGRKWRDLRAAEFYVLALAHETLATRRPKELSYDGKSQ